MVDATQDVGWRWAVGVRLDSSANEQTSEHKQKKREWFTDLLRFTAFWFPPIFLHQLKML